MAANEQDFAAGPAITWSLNNLADTSSVTSTAVDLGDPGPWEITLKLELTGAGAGAVEYVHIFAEWSDDNSEFDDSANGAPVSSVLLNGTTKAIKHVPITVVNRYVRFTAENQSGAALSSSTNVASLIERTGIIT